MKSVAPLSLVFALLAAANARAQEPTPPSSDETAAKGEAAATPPAEAAKPDASPGPTEANRDEAAKPSASAAAEASAEAGTPSAGVAASNSAAGTPDARRASLGVQNSLAVSSGLLRTSEAGSGAPGTFRVSLLGSFYSGSGFLCDGTANGGCAYVDPSQPNKDQAKKFGATFGFSVTPWSFLEGFLGVRAKAASNNQHRPRVLQALGDLNLGAKVFAPVGRLLRFGGQADIWFLGDAGNVGVASGATSYSLRGLGTLDLTEGGRATSAPPLKAHLNLGWYFDNASQLVTHNESVTGRPITRIERFGLGVNRLDSLQVGLGVEGVWTVARPFIEWSIDVPEARQKYTCVRERVDPGDGCLKSGRSMSATPSRLGIGARFFPWASAQGFEGLSLTAAFEVGTGATSKFLEEVVPELPWNLYLGVGYALDVTPRKPVVVHSVKVERVEAPKPIHHFITGRVVDKASSEPIPRAIVEYDGRDITGMVADQKGTFKTLDLEPGAYRFKISADGYRPGECQATVPATADKAEGEGKAATGPSVGPDGSITASVDCPLEALPKVGSVTGTIIDPATGAPVAGARVKIKDKLERELNLTAGATGGFRFEDVPPGKVKLEIEAPDYLTSAKELEVKPREDVNVRLNLNHRPKKASVEVAGKEIKLGRTIQFESDSSRLVADAHAVVEEIADLLRKRTDLRLVEVQGHTDDVGPAIDNRKLSQQRAEAVREELIALGVEAARLAANGYGPDKPLVPNTSDANRAKNRRVQFVVLEKTQTP
jgi:outer membrane protein OmpA-like peptidoglycan-associated protein